MYEKRIMFGVVMGDSRVIGDEWSLFRFAPTPSASLRLILNSEDPDNESMALSDRRISI